MLSQKRICGADSCRGAWLRLWRPVGDVSHVFSRVVASRRFRRVGGVSRAGVRWLRQWCGGSAGPSARRRRLLISSARCSESPFVAGLGWQRCPSGRLVVAAARKCTAPLRRWHADASARGDLGGRSAGSRKPADHHSDKRALWQPRDPSIRDHSASVDHTSLTYPLALPGPRAFSPCRRKHIDASYTIRQPGAFAGPMHSFVLVQ